MKLIIKKGLFFLVFDRSYINEDPNPTEISLNSVSTWEAGLQQCLYYLLTRVTAVTYSNDNLSSLYLQADAIEL